MRIVGILALAILLPACTHAAELININTADAALLDTLPGIGSVIAGRIIEYRNTNGPFTSIEGIQKVSGIGSGSTYAKIAPLITIDDASAPSTPDPAASSTPPTNEGTSTVEAVSASNGDLAEYLSIPILDILAGGNRTVSSGADTPFSATVYDDKGNKRDDAVVTWSFGDGMRKTGMSVYHPYYGPGEYLVVIRAFTSDGGDARSEIVVMVKDASIKISSLSPRGIALTNSDSRTLDLSLWRLSAGGQEFKIPADTHILAGHTILFPSQVIELPITNSAFLLYPSGEVVAVYPATVVVPQTNAIVQLPPVAVSYESVQAVEPIISTETNIQDHEDAVIAPAATTKLAAAGAALPDTGSRATRIFKSPWTLGFLGTLVLASGAFILL